MQFSPERMFGSKKGFHIEFKSKEDAQLFYQQGLELGNRVELHGNLVIMLNSKVTKKSSY
jgi:hypothetical protein